MRCLFAVFLLWPGLADSLIAAEPTLPEAKQRLWRGNYAEARKKFQVLTKQIQFQISAALGISHSWQSEGEYDKAQATIEASLKTNPKNADLLARLAELHYFRGRWAAAEKAAQAALNSNKNHFLARWIRGQIARDRGDLRKADNEFRWFVRTYTERSNQGKDIKDPEELLMVGLAGSENARWHSLSDQFDFILTEVYRDALKANKDYWWAEYHAGMLLLEKHNAVEALEAFNKAETINARAAEVLVGRGLVALQKLDMQSADNLAKRALRINPKLPEALRLLADILWVSGDLKATVNQLEKALAVNAVDEQTLGRLAACYFMRKDKDQKKYDQLVRDVKKVNSRPGVFYSLLAEKLEERRHFNDAERFYLEAIKHRPMLATSHASLGLLYMRMGREKDARAVLQKALKIDEFNLRVSNNLKVLGHLDKYQAIKTAHFLLKLDPKNDKVLGRFMAIYLENIYDDLAKQFNYQPKGPILIEVFNKHEMFSGRVISIPDLHTIGACTGRIIAMVSPRDTSKVIRKPFNWVRVLRHELVHIFNLEQTNFLVPHWFTEGLAVRNERYPMSPSWNRLLVRRYPDSLLNLGNVNMAFIRPQSSEEWNLAYMQSLLYVQYLREKYKDKSIGEMLEAYRAGLDTASAIQKVCKVSRADFERGYRSYVGSIAKKITRKPLSKPLSTEALVKAHEQKPDDPDIAAQLAERYLLSDEKKEALKLAKKALAKKATHPLAGYVRARLLIDAGDEEQAIILLKTALDRKNPEFKVLALLASLYFEAKKYAAAADLYELARNVDPEETRWLVRLAQVYGRSEKNKELISVLKSLAPLDPDDLATRKRLATLLLRTKDYSQAEKFARQALEIDVLDPEAQNAMRESLKKQNKNDKLEEFNKLVEP